MSSSDFASRGLSTALLAAVLVAAGGLAGCTSTGIRPLYGGAGGATTVSRLEQVDVVAPGRLGQLIRNESVFAYGHGAGSPDRPRWRLEVTTATTDTAVGIDRYKNLASAYLGQVTATWVLTEITTGRTLTSGSSFANAAYDYSQQRFADLRALRDAQDRAATMIALDIRTKIAVWFAENPNP